MLTLLSSLTVGFHVLYCMGIKSVIASNNCTNSDAGIYNMHRCDAVKGGYSSFVLNITMKNIFAGGDVITLITCYYYSSLRMFTE